MNEEIRTLLAKHGISLEEEMLNRQLDPAVPALAPLFLSKNLLSEHGYFYLFWSDHPNATKSGKVHLHRHIAALTRGSWLRKDEIVVFLDGDKKNLREQNLSITTRREHGQRVNNFTSGGERQSLTCEYCSRMFTESYSHAERRKTCSPTCAALSRRKFDPDPAELEKLVWEMPTTKVAELFDVSDKAVGKRCKLYGLEKPPRGYWARVHAGYLP